MNSRYPRNISLIGKAGQDILLDSKVLVIGCGGLASPLLYYLAAAGVGKIGIIDHDTVSLPDLQRQILFNTDVINKPKVRQAKEVLEKLNPDCTVAPYQYSLTEENIEIIDDFDVIAECSDSFEVKSLVNKNCYMRKKPLILGAVIGLQGYVGTFKPYVDKNYPCYQCFCPEIPEEESRQSCKVVGVLNSVVGTLGSIQATAVIKELLHMGLESPNKLIRVNLDSFTVSFIKADPKCEVCKLDLLGDKYL